MGLLGGAAGWGCYGGWDRVQYTGTAILHWHIAAMTVKLPILLTLDSNVPTPNCDAPNKVVQQSGVTSAHSCHVCILYMEGKVLKCLCVCAHYCAYVGVHVCAFFIIIYIGYESVYLVQTDRQTDII